MRLVLLLATNNQNILVMVYLTQPKIKAFKFILLASILIGGCGTPENNFNFKSNASYSRIEEPFRLIAKDYDLSITYFNQGELRTEYKVLGKKNDQWTKLLFSLDYDGNFQKKWEKQLSEQDGRISILSLEQYDLFNIAPEDILLKEHVKLCGKPRDPSHYLEYSLVLVSGKSVRQLQFCNPGGRFIMCPAIKQWENAAKISEFFEREWIEKK
jgi:hypothetical protein